MTEIYFNQELSDITFEIDKLDEWKKICNELGMEQQLGLTKGKVTPIPYPYMNEVMIRVYRTLCPNSWNYKEFKTVPIPLEVLKQISFSVKEKHFHRIELWADDKNPDPVVVGYHGTWREYPYDNKSNEKLKGKIFSSKQEVLDAGGNSPEFQEEGKYLIARFGDELKPFDKLKELAIKRFIEENAGEMQKEIALLTQKFNTLKENAVSYFNDNMTRYDAIGKW